MTTPPTMADPTPTPAGAPNAVAVLRELEFVQIQIRTEYEHYNRSHCPMCSGQKLFGHAPDCRLHAALSASERTDEVEAMAQAVEQAVSAPAAALSQISASSDAGKRDTRTVDAPAAAVEAGAGEAGGWFDIASAPKDETEILVTNAHILSWYQVVSWDDERPGGAWTDVEGQFAYHPEMPTHWMPLPKPPGVTPTDAALPAQVTALAQWEDPTVQLIYGVLTDGAVPPEEEHWEGFAARRIATALARGAGHD